MFIVKLADSMGACLGKPQTGAGGYSGQGYGQQGAFGQNYQQQQGYAPQQGYGQDPGNDSSRGKLSLKKFVHAAAHLPAVRQQLWQTDHFNVHLLIYRSRNVRALQRALQRSVSG